MIVPLCAVHNHHTKFHWIMKVDGRMAAVPANQRLARCGQRRLTA
jgi:hypothetical protein